MSHDKYSPEGRAARSYMDQLVGRSGPSRSDISVRRAQAQVDQRIMFGDLNPDGTRR